jgi:hypothetical protein
VIAQRLVATFPEHDFNKIKLLHESRRSDRLKFTTKQLFAVALAGIAFVGKSVPKSVIEEDVGWEYSDFERALFYLTCLVLIYLGIALIAEWFSLRRKIEKHAFFGSILAYLDLCKAPSKT